jgi:dimethylargininase
VRTLVVESVLTAGTFAADLAVVLGSGAVLMRPSDPLSRGDVARVESALTGAGIPIIGRIEAPGLLDGGDVLVGSDTAYIGIPLARSSSTGLARGARGNELGRRQFAAFAQQAGLKTVDVGISSDARRLRAVAAFVDRNTIVFGGRVVDGEAFAGLERIVTIEGEEYGAGVLAVGRRRVIANVRFRFILETLRRARVGVDAIDLWEFGKVGATPSMLTLALKRS